MKLNGKRAVRLGAAALLIAVAALGSAQGFGGGQGGPGMGGPMGRPDKLAPLMGILMRPDVAQEIGLTEAQQDQIWTIMENNRPEMGQDGPPDRTKMEAQMAKMETKIKAVLSNTQAKRIDEIRIQMAGLTAALVPDVQAKLSLSSEQKAKLKALVPQEGDRGPGMGGPPPGGMGGPGGGGFGGPPQGGFGGGNFGGGRGQGQGQGGFGGGQQGGQGRGPQGDNRRKELETKIAAILTENQKSTLKALGGKTFAGAQMRGRGQ